MRSEPLIYDTESQTQNRRAAEGGDWGQWAERLEVAEVGFYTQDRETTTFPCLTQRTTFDIL